MILHIGHDTHVIPTAQSLILGSFEVDEPRPSWADILWANLATVLPEPGVY